MPGTSTFSSFHLARILTCCSFIAFAQISIAGDLPFFSMFHGQMLQAAGAGAGLVRVNIVTRYEGSKDTVEINGIVIAKSPVVIEQRFSSTGIVLDDQGNIMTFLGYRWLDIQNHDPDIDVSRAGRRLKGKLVGIDQRNGVAVVKVDGGKLKRTPVCRKCEVKDGAIVMVPVSAETMQFRQTQVVSIGDGQPMPASGRWIMTVDRPFPDIELPILTADHRVLGFVASQDAMGIRNIVYPVSELIESAEKILKTGGDIFAGWLGLYLADSDPAMGPGVVVNNVEPDSPAQSAGLAAGDLLFKFNGHSLKDSGQFIRLVEGAPIGSRADIEILRKGKPMTLSASVGARRPQPSRGRLSFNFPAGFGFPAAEAIPESVPRNQRLLIGVETLYLESELAGVLQIPVQKGLLVIEVLKDAPAEKAGVQVGDVIVAIDNQPITDPLAFTGFLQSHDWGSLVLLQVNRKGTPLTLPIHIAAEENQHLKVNAR